MKVVFLIVFGVLFLNACSTNQNASIEPIDLIGNKAAVLAYWEIDKKVAPKYSEQAKTQRVSGCVEFSLIIDSNGNAINPKVIKAFPENIFNKQATRAIKKWKWVPTSTNPNRQPVVTTIQQDFVVKKSPNWQEAYNNCKI